MPANKKHSFLYKNSLSIFFLFLFLITLGGQALTGWRDHNEDLTEKHAQQITLTEYLQTGHFISATFENFESEFLQMAMYVLITIKLRQIGSSESKAIDKEEEVDREPVPHKDSPWAVKKGGFILALYSNSLSLAFLILFLISWGLHLFGSFTDYNVEQVISHKQKLTIYEFLLEPRFWFETFQNWQSEFLSVFSIVFLTIFLRQKGSPESKPVDAPNMETGK
jgi:hypothetical protein